MTAFCFAHNLRKLWMFRHLFVVESFLRSEDAISVIWFHFICWTGAPHIAPAGKRAKNNENNYDWNGSMTNLTNLDLKKNFQKTIFEGSSAAILFQATFAVLKCAVMVSFPAPNRQYLHNKMWLNMISLKSTLILSRHIWNPPWLFIHMIFLVLVIGGRDFIIKSTPKKGM